MSKWLEDLLLNIEIWLYRRLRKLLQHGGTDFAVSLDTLHAELAQKEQYRDGVYLHLKERLEGTDEHPLAEGVPVRPLPATQDLAHLQAAVELLADRKIEDSSPDIPDGVSFERLLCDSTISITELIDTNFDWETSMPQFPFTPFPNLKRLVLNCVKMNNAHIVPHNGTCQLDYLELPYLKEFVGGPNKYADSNFVYGYNGKTLYIPKLKKYSCMYNSRSYDYLGNLAVGTFQEFIAPSLEGINDGSDIGIHCQFLNAYHFNNVGYLRKIVIGKLEVFSFNFMTSYSGNNNNLIHFEIGDGTNINLNFGKWNPTQALRTDTTASDYIDLREDKDDSGEFINATNIEQFLSNFKNYIADRLADRTGQSTLTLTLSQAVRDVLTAEIEDIIVSQKHWVISPAKSV